MVKEMASVALGADGASEGIALLPPHWKKFQAFDKYNGWFGGNGEMHNQRADNDFADLETQARKFVDWLTG